MDIMAQKRGDRLVFKEHCQRKLLSDVISRENLSQKRLAKLMGVSRRGVRHWINEDRLLPESVLTQMTNLFPWIRAYKNYVINKLPSNWGQTKGGIKRVKMKDFNAQRKKVVGPKGEIMYNNQEKKIAEFLHKNNLRYKYEPVIKLESRCYIPDFVIGKNIIERCGYGDWNIYWSNIIRKLKQFEKYKIGKVFILVPSRNFNLAIKKLQKLNNLIILKEEEIEVLPELMRAHGPITTKVVGKAQHGRAASS